MGQKRNKLTPTFNFDWSMDGCGKNISKMNPTEASIDIGAGLINSHARTFSRAETYIPDMIKREQTLRKGYPLHHNYEMCNKHFYIHELVKAV